MKRLLCLLLTTFALIAEDATAENPASPCPDASQRDASLALIDDTAVLHRRQLAIEQPKGPAVTYLTKLDAGDMANNIMQHLARDKEVRSVMLSSHEKLLTVTGDMRTQKIVLEIIAEIENPQPRIESGSLVELVRAALRNRKSKQQP